MFNAGTNRALVAAAALVNTAEMPQSGRPTGDQLETVAGLKAFLADQDPQLNWTGTRATGKQLEKVRQLRTTLRTVWETGPVTTSTDLSVINGLLAGVGTELVRPEVPGEPAICEAPIPVSSAIHHVMTATVAAALAHLVVAEETGRLRICRGDDCQAAIVDLTRNRSKLFCDFGNCANRSHVRAYRARQAAQQEDSPSTGGVTPKLDKPSAAEKAEELDRPTSVSAVAAKKFRSRMREELMEARRSRTPKK